MGMGKMPETSLKWFRKKKSMQTGKGDRGRERKQVWKKMLKVMVKATVQGCYVNYLVTFL